MGTITTFDLDRFTRAAEERDAATQLSMYGPNAVVTIADKVSQPGAPQVLRTREEIQAWLEDIYGRDMTHSVRHALSDGDTAALWVDCEYPDGTRVRCAGAIEVRDGKITHEDVVQEWD